MFACSALSLILGVAVIYHQACAFSSLTALGKYGQAIEICNDSEMMLSGIGLLLVALELPVIAFGVGIAVSVFGVAVLFMQCLQSDFLTSDFFGLLGMSQTFPRHRIPLSAGILSFLIGAGLVLQCEKVKVRQRSALLMLVALPIVLIGVVTAFAFIISWSKDEADRLFFITSFRLVVVSSVEFIVVGLGLLCVAWARRPVVEVGPRELGRSIVLHSSAAVFVVSIVGSLFAVMPFYDRLRDTFDQSVLDGMKNIALSGEAFLNLVRGDLTHLDSRQPNFALPARAFNIQSSADAALQSARESAGSVESENYVLGISQLGKNGAVLKSIGAEIPKSMWPHDVATDLELSVHGPFEWNQTLVLLVSVPSLPNQSNGEIRDLVMVNAHIFEDIFHNYRERNALGQLYLGSYEGNQLSLFTFQNSTAQLVPSRDSPAGVISFFGKSSPKAPGLVMPNDLSREPLLSAFVPLRGSDLGMAISVPLRDLYAETVKELFSIIIGALIFAALSAAGIFFLIRGMIRHAESLQSQVKTSLAEKDDLLEEIHHRVKNNLQIIMSLLRLQARNLRDQAALTVFEESQNRIESISLLHELCYGSKNLVEIGAKEFIQKLARRLTTSYAIDSRYSVQLSGDEMPLHLDTAVPFALLMNELLTQGIKLYLQENSDPKGQMDIRLERRDGQCSVSLFSRDQRFLNAVDLTGPVTFSARLIGNLLKQLRGKLEIVPGAASGEAEGKGMMFSFLNKSKTGGTNGSVDGSIAHSHS